MKFKRESRGSKKGYTMMEILVVVVIVMVVAAIAYPLYSKSVMKARAAEAVNLLEIVRAKQISRYALSRRYYDNFEVMGRLTQNAGREEAEGNKMKMGDYELEMDSANECIKATYKKNGSEFTLATSYENAGLGCSGEICSSFGDVVGGIDEVCRVGGGSGGVRSCTSGDTRGCGRCGTQTCSSAGTWGSCSGEGACSSGAVETVGCGSGYTGNRTRTCSASCVWGEWTTSGCVAMVCTPGNTQACGKCGTQTCGSTGTWGSCSGEGACSSGEIDTDACEGGYSGNRIRTCSASCGWGDWDISECTPPEEIECEGSKVDDGNGNCVCPNRQCLEGQEMNPDTCQCEDKCEEPKLGCGEGKTWDEGACECVEDCQKPREINKESGECECATVGKCITTQEWNEKTCSCEDKKEEECLPPNVKKKCSGLGLAIGKVGLIDEIGDVGKEEEYCCVTCEEAGGREQCSIDISTKKKTCICVFDEECSITACPAGQTLDTAQCKCVDDETCPGNQEKNESGVCACPVPGGGGKFTLTAPAETCDLNGGSWDPINCICTCQDGSTNTTGMCLIPDGNGNTPDPIEVVLCAGFTTWDGTCCKSQNTRPSWWPTFNNPNDNCYIHNYQGSVCYAFWQPNFSIVNFPTECFGYPSPNPSVSCYDKARPRLQVNCCNPASSFKNPSLAETACLANSGLNMY